MSIVLIGAAYCRFESTMKYTNVTKKNFALFTHWLERYINCIACTLHAAREYTVRTKETKLSSSSVGRERILRRSILLATICWQRRGGESQKRNKRYLKIKEYPIERGNSRIIASVLFCVRSILPTDYRRHRLRVSTENSKKKRNQNTSDTLKRK